MAFVLLACSKRKQSKRGEQRQTDLSERSVGYHLYLFPGGLPLSRPRNKIIREKFLVTVALRLDEWTQQRRLRYAEAIQSIGKECNQIESFLVKWLLQSYLFFNVDIQFSQPNPWTGWRRGLGAVSRKVPLISFFRFWFQHCILFFTQGNHKKKIKKFLFKIKFNF